MTMIQLTMPVVGKVMVTGELTAGTAVALAQDGITLIQNCDKECTVYLGGVTKVSSAGLAVLLAWWRCALIRKIHLKFEQVPEAMLGLLTVSGLDTVLPLVWPTIQE